MKPGGLLKQLAFQAVLWLILVATVALAQPSRVLGTWVQEGKEAVWTFRPDGSGFMEQTTPRATARFTWSFEGERLQVCTGGLAVPYTILSADSQSLVIRNDQLETVYRLKKKG